jgi:hypothetical protein
MKYTPPLRLYLVISFICLLMLAIIDSYEIRSEIGVINHDLFDDLLRSISVDYDNKAIVNYRKLSF